MRQERRPLPYLLFSLFAGALLLLAVPAAADVLVLTDGTRLEGTIRRVGENYTVTAEDGTVTTVAAEKVASVEIRGAGAPEGRLDARLESLRRSVANLDDMALIIGRYEDFIRRNTGTPAAEEAQKDLAEWRDRLERGLVKYGGEWLTPAERDLKLRDAFLEVNDARTQIKQGELEAAQRILGRMLRQNPQDVSALYLLGVIELKRGEIGKARDHFEKVRDQESSHPPTLVNLAAINFEQNNVARALTFLAEAMTQEPGNREILDNVAEALQLLPPKEAEGRQAEQVRQLFLSQDSALRQKMAERGLYRWGSTWVNREQLTELEEIEKQIKGRIDELAAERARIVDEIAAIERRYEANERYMERLQANRVYRDKDGKLFQIPLPPEYYETARENDMLVAERDNLLRAIAQVQEAQRQEESRYPTPPFKGQLEPIGEDGVPVRLPPGSSPTSLPGVEAGAEANPPATRPAESGEGGDDLPE